MSRRKPNYEQIFVEMFEERKELYKVAAKSAAQMAALDLYERRLTQDAAAALKVIEAAVLRHFEKEVPLWKQALLRMAASQRQRDGINRARPPATMAARIRAAPDDIPAAVLAERIGCGRRYVNMVRKAEAEKMKAETTGNP